MQLKPILRIIEDSNVPIRISQIDNTKNNNFTRIILDTGRLTDKIPVTEEQEKNVLSSPYYFI